MCQYCETKNSKGGIAGKEFKVNKTLVLQEKTNTDNDEVVLDVIPIYKNEMYPTKEMIWHFRADIKTGTDREYLLNNMFMEIKHKFADCNAVIILEKGMVIEIL